MENESKAGTQPGSDGCDGGGGGAREPAGLWR